MLESSAGGLSPINPGFFMRSPVSLGSFRGPRLVRPPMPPLATVAFMGMLMKPDLPMKKEWNPELFIRTQERGMLIEINLTGWHHLGIRLTPENRLLHIHRSPMDGPHKELILECPAEFDTYAATGEARAGSFRIALPLHSEAVRKRLREERLREQHVRAVQCAGSFQPLQRGL